MDTGTGRQRGHDGPHFGFRHRRAPEPDACDACPFPSGSYALLPQSDPIGAEHRRLNPRGVPAPIGMAGL
jgi:hypothetical protein